MGLLEHLGLVERAQQAAAERQQCVRCGHRHVASMLVNVMDAPYPMPAYMGTHLPQLVDVLVCRAGCPEPIGPHPALPRQAGLRSWEWTTSCQQEG